MQPQAQEDPPQEFHEYPQIQFPLGSMGTLEVPKNHRKMPFEGLSLFRENTEQIGEEQNEQQLGRGHVEEAEGQQQLATSGYHVPPGINIFSPPIAEHDTLLASRDLFEEALGTFHGSLGRRLTVPHIEGQELDLYAFYREVTACGGLEQVIRDRRWREVARALNFPGSIINPSFVLRKHYIDLLYHFEKIYYFKAHGQLPYPPGPLPAPLPIVKSIDDKIAYQNPVDSAHSVKKRRKVDPTQLFGVNPGASVGHITTGAIDGKFDNGYFITVVVGSEKLHGILYHVPTENASPQFATIPGLIRSVGSELDALGLQVQVNKKKKETAPKKDPNAPRPAKKSYNFFYAEQCARLKKNHSPTHRELARMVADLWNNLSDNEKLPYIEQSRRERERYKREMEDYKKRLRVEAHGEVNIGSDTVDVVGQENEGPDVNTFYQDGSHDYHVSLDTDADMNSFHMHQQQEADVPVAEPQIYSNQADGDVYSVVLPEPQVSEFHLETSGCLTQTYGASGDGYSYQNATLLPNVCQPGFVSCPMSSDQVHWVQEGSHPFCVQEDHQV